MAQNFYVQPANIGEAFMKGRAQVTSQKRQQTAAKQDDQNLAASEYGLERQKTQDQVDWGSDATKDLLNRSYQALEEANAAAEGEEVNLDVLRSRAQGIADYSLKMYEETGIETYRDAHDTTVKALKNGTVGQLMAAGVKAGAAAGALKLPQQGVDNSTELERGYQTALQQGFDGTMLDYQRALANLKDQPKSNVKPVEGTVDGNPAFGVFDPSTRTFIDPDTQEPIVGFKPAEKTPATSVNVDLSGGAKSELFKTVGRKAGEQLVEKHQKASDAVRALQTTNEAQKLLDAGMITGFGSNFLTSFGSALNKAGISYNEDPVANTQAYGAVMAKQVAEIIKAFGAGTGLSDADREFAIKAAGGDVTMNEAAIRKIMEINNKASMEAIKTYNTAREFLGEDIMGVLPEVQIPEFGSTDEIQSLIDKYAD
jgi:hypothetical protein